MAKSDALFILIKSLTKSEKRYFKVTTGFHGGQQNYLKLFEALDRMKTYSEERLRAHFKGEAWLKQLHVAKNYLYNLILKSLRGYHLKESTAAQLRSMMIDVEVLFKKDLLKQCYRVVVQAEKLAQKAGDELVLLDTLNWKRRVLLNMRGSSQTKHEVDQITKEEQEALDRLIDENTFWQLTMGVGSRIPGEDPGITQHPLMVKAPAKMTHRSTILYHHLKYVYHTMAGALDSAGDSLDQLIRYLEHDSFRLKNDPSSYVTALNNKIGLYLNQKKHQQVPGLLKKIRDLPVRLKLKASNPVSMKLLIRTYNVELETYRDTGQIEKGIQLIPRVRSFLQTYYELIPRQYIVLFHYQFSYLFFVNGDFSSALKDVNTVLNHRSDEDRSDIIGYAHFLNLIIHYELGNATVMKYSVETCRRFLKKRGNLEEFEKVLLRIFSRLSTRPRGQHRAIIKKGAEKLFSDPPIISHSQLDYLDFRFWMESKSA